MLGVSARTGNLVTGSADKTVKCFDLRGGEGKNLARVKSLTTSDSVLCGELLDSGNLCVVGQADGNIAAFDLSQGGKTGGTSLYGFGAEAVGAVNCMAVAPDMRTLITGGDSGQALKLSYAGS